MQMFLAKRKKIVVKNGQKIRICQSNLAIYIVSIRIYWFLLLFCFQYNARDTSPLSIFVMHPFWNHIVEVNKSLSSNLCENFYKIVFLLVLSSMGGTERHDIRRVSLYSTKLCDAFVVRLEFLRKFWTRRHNTNSKRCMVVCSILHICGLYIRFVQKPVKINILFNNCVKYPLDGIDGKQARRIGLSGPLGELFDHGLDSYTAVLIPTCLYSIYGRGESSIPPLRMFYIIWMVFFNFFISHWEKYNTGVLYLPWGYDFSMWGSTTLYLITWLGTYQIWKIPLPFGISPGLAMEFILHISALSSLPMVTYNMYM